MSFEEYLSSLKKRLESLMTADNTETITSAVKDLDELNKLHGETTNEVSSLKNKIVDIVKGTTFHDVKPQDNPAETTEGVSFEEACKQAEAKILSQREVNKK